MQFAIDCSVVILNGGGGGVLCGGGGGVEATQSCRS